MATLLTLLDDLRERMGDAGDTEVTRATKVRWINHGINAMWPRLYRTVVDESLTTVTDQYEYDIPASVGDNALITRIDVQNAAGRFVPIEASYLLPVNTGKVLVLDDLLQAGYTIRVTSAKRLAQLTLDTDVYDGPEFTAEIPVWYALALAMGKGHFGRIDHTRYATVMAQNGVDINEVMGSVQFCMGQFEALLDAAAMPLPSAFGG